MKINLGYLYCFIIKTYCTLVREDLATGNWRVMDFYNYTKGGHGPQRADPLVLYVFSIECCGVFRVVSFYEGQNINFQVISRV